MPFLQFGVLIFQCSHDLSCPMKRTARAPCNFSQKFIKSKPFEVLTLHDRLLSIHSVLTCILTLNPIIQDQSKSYRTEFSYVIFKKGERSDSGKLLIGLYLLWNWVKVHVIAAKPWPRIVREKLSPSKQTICKVCTEQGKLEIVNLTRKKHGEYVPNSTPYNYNAAAGSCIFTFIACIYSLFTTAKSCKWGDLLPAVEDPTKRKQKIKPEHEEHISATNPRHDDAETTFQLQPEQPNNLNIKLRSTTVDFVKDHW